MGRLPRSVADGPIYHALNRGNNRAAVFDTPADYALFLHALGQTRQRYPFRLFGYCLMPNHFHLLLQPDDGQNISRILQSLTFAHTWYFHKSQHTSGHVWQGRFKSPVIQDDDHLLTVLRYIEANPLRAGLVSDPAAYRWSSFAAHALGQADPLLSAAPVWGRLGKTEAARQARWRAWVREPLTERELAAVRKAVTSGRPYGSPSWVDATAKRLGTNLASRPRGRPKKIEEK
jgi:putative transposase